ncbi:hypothetical protein ACFL6X_03405 [Candidatus Latescibacterota bacterium]
MMTVAWPILGMALTSGATMAWGQAETPDTQLTRFNVTTYDGLKLPAQVLASPSPDSRLVVFVFGSTPYDEQGNQWAGWNESGENIGMRHRFYSRFLEVMSAKGYGIATMAKRSFVHSKAVPRPSLDELALDIQSLILELSGRGLAHPETLYLVGYSEGSTVVTKVVGLLKEQPAGVILLGSGSMDHNYETQPWQEWYMTDIYRQAKGWSDEELEKEYREYGALTAGMLEVDEKVFESEWKKHGSPHGFGLAPWESYHINREVPFYNCTANLMAADTPLLFAIGEDDTAMPMMLVKRNYDRLVDGGFEKATLRVIGDEGHGYRKHDVYAIMDAWIKSEGESADIALDDIDRALIARHALGDEIARSVSELPWEGEAEGVLGVFRSAAEANLDDSDSWFKLGLVLFGNSHLSESLLAFERASDPGFLARFAALVWIGHLRDLQGQREEAVESYREALQIYPGFPVQHDNWGIVVDKSWIETRLENPFRGVSTQEP